MEALKSIFDTFFARVNGKFIEVEDSSNVNQCFDLAFAWCDELKIPRSAIRHLYAYQIYTLPNSNTKDWFEIVPNTPTGVPTVGSLVIFGTKVGTAGHVCISNGIGDTQKFQSVDQNWGNPKSTRLVTHDYVGVLGWLKPLPIDLVAQKDEVIAWNDFEGKRKTVEWYVREWEVEKKAHEAEKTDRLALIEAIRKLLDN